MDKKMYKKEAKASKKASKADKKMAKKSAKHAVDSKFKSSMIQHMKSMEEKKEISGKKY